jgi:hypothetical protein
MANMFWPLCTQGTDTEERKCCKWWKGGRRNAAAQRENQRKKMQQCSNLFIDFRPQGHPRTLCLNQKM